NDAPAQGSHAAVLIGLHACFVGRSEALHLDGRDTYARAELDRSGADEMVLLASLEILPFDLLEKGVTEDTSVPIGVCEFPGVHLEYGVPVPAARFQNFVPTLTVQRQRR